jgi:hypothetical protein
MLMITSAIGHSLSTICEETNEKLEKTILDCVLETENGVPILTLTAKSGSYHYKTCCLMWGSLYEQRLWQAYMNLVWTLLQVQTEAANRQISIEGKSQEQLVKEIIAYECQVHGTPFLLEDDLRGFSWVLNTGSNIEIDDPLVTTDLEPDCLKKSHDPLHPQSLIAKALEHILWNPGESKRKIAICRQRN